MISDSSLELVQVTHGIPPATPLNRNLCLTFRARGSSLVVDRSLTRVSLTSHLCHIEDMVHWRLTLFAPW